MNEKVVPRKNYFLLILLIILVVVVTFAVTNIVSSVRNKKINSGYINKYVSELQYKELNNYLVEPANNTFIYITYTGDKDVYNLETKLKKLINNYELQTNFIYVNVTDLMNDADFIKKLNENVKTDSIKRLPVILYYKDGNLTEVIDGENEILTDAEFQKVLDKYEIGN